jgi:hypothetical protein
MASWYIRSTPSGDMLHLLHKKGRRSDHLSTPPQGGIVEKEQIIVMDNLEVPNKELRCEACRRIIKPERDEKLERVIDEDGLVRVFCELDLCRQERLQVHIRAFNVKIAPERAGMESPPKPMVRICESCGREIKVERGEQSHPVLQKNGVIRMFCTLPMCDLDARVVEEEEERANA